MKKEIRYPAEITFKSIFINRPEIAFSIDGLLVERGLAARISCRASGNDRFVSYTITAVFESASLLDDVCSRLSSLEGFIMLI